VLKVRANQAPDDYRDPGPYAFPSGSVAFEYQGPLPETLRPPNPPQGTPVPATPAPSPAAPAHRH